MGYQNRGGLVLWLILISGFLVVTTLEENIEKDEAFLTQFVAPSTGMVNEQMVSTCPFACLILM